MKRFKRVMAAALVCILTLCAATGCGGSISSEKTTECSQILEYREYLYSEAGTSLITDNNLSSAAGSAYSSIRNYPDTYLEGYELYMSGNKTDWKAVDYDDLLNAGPNVNGALYRILLYDGDMTVKAVEAQMETEFNKEITSGAYYGKSYKDCLQTADTSVAVVVYYVENTIKEEAVWAVIELVYGLDEEPALA